LQVTPPRAEIRSSTPIAAQTVSASPPSASNVTPIISRRTSGHSDDHVSDSAEDRPACEQDDDQAEEEQPVEEALRHPDRKLLHVGQRNYSSSRRDASRGVSDCLGLVRIVDRPDVALDKLPAEVVAAKAGSTHALLEEDRWPVGRVAPATTSIRGIVSFAWYCGGSGRVVSPLPALARSSSRRERRIATRIRAPPHANTYSV